MTEEPFSPGRIFFRPGDPGDRAYLLREGQVELLSGDSERLTRVGLFGAEDVFGEMALIEERPRVFTARAVSHGRAVAMTREEFEHHLIHDPHSARHYLRSLFERLRSLTAQVGGDLELAAEEPTSPAKPARSRVAPIGRTSSAGWVVVLHPLSPDAARGVPDEGLPVTRFPFRIGRATAAGEPAPYDLNDVWFHDRAPFQVSRNHCEIHLDSEGLVVRDRGSQLGCFVNDEWIGARAAIGCARLTTGDNTLVLGLASSPFRLNIRVNPA